MCFLFKTYNLYILYMHVIMHVLALSVGVAIVTECEIPELHLGYLCKNVNYTNKTGS